MKARAPKMTVGQTIPGTKYRIRREIGAGGMGVVYEVIKEPSIVGVLKMMSIHLTNDASFRERFVDEVRILAELDHPNIVRVFDYDILADGTPYYVMELLSGQSLAEAISRTGRLPSRVAFQAARQLCDALDCAHTNTPAIIHRDVKPDNIFLHSPKRGEPLIKLIDFGVSAIADRLEDRAVAGTLHYAAPEQLQGKPATPAADIFAVGCVLYEMLCGASPFDAVVRTSDDAASVGARLRFVPRPLSDHAPWLPDSVSALVRAALDPDASRRPQSARAFAERLVELEDAPDGIVSGVVQRAPKRASGSALRTLTEGFLAASPGSVGPAPSRSAEPPSKPADTFSSQHSDAVAGVPRGRSRRRAALITAAAASVIAVGVLVRTRGAGPRVAQAPSAASSAAVASSLGPGTTSSAVVPAILATSDTAAVVPAEAGASVLPPAPPPSVPRASAPRVRVLAKPNTGAAPTHSGGAPPTSAAPQPSPAHPARADDLIRTGP